MRVKRWNCLIVAVAFCGATIIMSNSSHAQTPADLDAATLSANIAEQQKKAAQARKDAAVADAEAANLATKTANDLSKTKAEVDKAKADAEKAQMDAVKAGLPTPPDPSKYRAEMPTAPTLNATITRLTYEQAEVLSTDLGTEIAAALANATPATTALIADDGKVRTLLALEQATREGLLSVTTRVTSITSNLHGKIAAQPTPAFAPGALLLIGSVLENVMAYASAMRTQWGFATFSATSNAEAVLVPLVQAKLVTKVSLVEADPTLALPSATSEISKGLAKLRTAIDSARKEISAAAAWSKDKRESTVPKDDKDEPGKKAHADAVKLADEVDRLALLVGTTSDEADKFVAAMFVVDAQMSTTFDAAQRGETLRGTLDNKDVYTLVVKVITSDADTVATDRLFSGLKVYVGNTTLARWKLIDSKGVVRGVGAKKATNGPHRIVLKTE